MAAEEEAPPAEMEFLQVQDEAQFLANDEVIGTDVLNDMDEKVGTIADLVMDQDQKLVGVVLSVGGFLGIGDKWVAVPVEQIELPERRSAGPSAGRGHRGAAGECARLHDARRRSRRSRRARRSSSRRCCSNRSRRRRAPRPIAEPHLGTVRIPRADRPIFFYRRRKSSLATRCRIACSRTSCSRSGA